jgi:capsular exopolysaccharide synthesis family protein
MDSREIEQLLAEETLDFKKYINLVLRYWYWFVISLGFCLGLAYIVTRTTHNVYQVDATILIRDDKNSKSNTGAEALLSELSLVNNTKSIQNEIGIIKSYTIAYNTIKELESIHTTYKLVGNSTFKQNVVYKDIPFRIVFNPGYDNPTEANITLEFTDGDNFIAKVNNSDFSEPKSIGQKVVIENFGFTVLPTASYSEKELSGKTYVVTRNDLNTLANQYKNKVTVNLVDKNASLISLSTTGQSADQEADYLNKLIEVYVRQGLEEKNQIAKNTIDFIDNQLFGMRDSLQRAEIQLRNFRTNNRILDIDKESSMLLDNLKELQTSKATAEINQRYFAYLKNYLQKRDKYSDIVAPYTLGIADVQLVNLLNDLTQLSSERENMKMSVKQNNPALQQLEVKIRNVKEALMEKVNSLIATNKLSNDDINSQINKIESNISSLPVNEQLLINKTKMYDLLDKMYTYLLEKKSEASIAKASNISDCKIVDPALPINAELKQPKPKMNYALGFILGLLIPLIVIILRDYFDNKIRTIKDLTGKLPDVSMLATLDHSQLPVDIPVIERPKSRLSESFRALRTNINYFVHGKKCITLLTTSLISGEGKTFCASNLAAIYALSGKRTLLIGLDLRKPKIQKMFELTNHHGMSGYLSEQGTFDKALKSTSISNLWVAVSGPIPPNPSELIGSPRMEQFLAEAREQFDCIIIDTPPVGIVTDARIIFDKVDIVLFVTRMGVSPKETVEYCKELHSNLGNKMALVINDFDSKKSYSNYSKYHYSYNKHYQSEYYEN